MLPRTLRLVYVVPSDRPYAPAYAVRSDRHCGLWPYDGQAGSNPKVRFADDPLAIALAGPVCWDESHQEGPLQSVLPRPATLVRFSTLP
jgi:hypothetical protein